MIHVLVHENRSRSRLSLLLRELGQSAIIHSEYENMIYSLRDETKKTDPILFDLNSLTSDDEPCLGRLKEESGGRPLIGFEEFDPDATGTKMEKAGGLRHYLLLPPQAERAKVRLRTVLAECRRAQNPTPSTAKKPAGKGFRRAFTPAGRGRPFTRKPTQPPLSKPGGSSLRYLIAESEASRHFSRQFLDSLSFEILMVLTGEAGSEFVLAAREAHYQLYGDQESMVVLPGDAVTLELLHSIEKKAKDSGKARLCYIERCEDAPAEAANALLQFVENLEGMRDPHLRLILSREDDYDFISSETEQILARLSENRVWLRMPPLADRPEDIRPIATGFLSALTYAHPFLSVKEFDTEALRYLEENRSRFSYQKMVQTLRNSIALGQQRVLTEETIKNFETHTPSGEHLIESTADEAYFPQEEPIYTT